MEKVTDRTRNPFGMRLPCDRPCAVGGPVAVHGYGDANADFHVVGDHPGVHGGATTAVPFTETVAGERLQGVLHDAGFLDEPYGDAPVASDLFCSYRHACCLPGERTPTDDQYADLERFFDAELRAINAHVLLPVGERTTRHVLETYTTRAGKVPDDEDALHATEIRGRGFMVVPVAEPADWTGGQREALRDRLYAILDSDYRQTKGVATTVG